MFATEQKVVIKDFLEEMMLKLNLERCKLIVGPLMDRNLVVRRVRERKRLISLGLCGKPMESCS